MQHPYETSEFSMRREGNFDSHVYICPGGREGRRSLVQCVLSALEGVTP